MWRLPGGARPICSAGASGAIWRLGDQISPPLPSSTADVLLFIAVGMIWSAARLFHGRRIAWSGIFSGAGVWLSACAVPAFADSADSRVVVSSLIVATYTFLIATELWRERRKSLLRRWPAIFVPMLHGAIFLFPMALASLSLDGGGVEALPTAGLRYSQSRSCSTWSVRRSSCWCWPRTGRYGSTAPRPRPIR